MSLRENCRVSEREYWRVIGEARKNRPREVVFNITGEIEGAEDGTMKYDPEKDSVEITFTSTNVRIPGVYLESLRNALDKLLG